MEKTLRTARREAAKQLKETSQKLPKTALDRLVGYAEGIAAGVDLAKKNERT